MTDNSKILFSDLAEKRRTVVTLSRINDSVSLLFVNIWLVGSLVFISLGNSFLWGFCLIVSVLYLIGHFISSHKS